MPAVDPADIPADLSKPRLRAVIAAAGQSSRFKAGHKALAPPDGPGLLARAVDALEAAGLKNPLVVVGHRGEEVAAEALSLGAEPVVNPDPERGMLSSVATGVQAAGGAAVVLLPVDAALVSGAAILGTAARFLALGGAGSILAVIPAFGGRTGHPPVLGGELAVRLAGWTGQGGLRGALGSMAGGAAAEAAFLSGSVPETMDGSLRFYTSLDPMVLCDIDTVEDLERALAAPAAPAAPGLADVLALLRLAGPPRKTPHAVTVAVLALRLAVALKAADPELAFLGGLLHDVDHGPSRHDLVAARRLAGLGWGDLAAVVGAHTELPPAWARQAGYDGPLGDRHAGDAALYEGRSPAVMEAAVLVHLADKYAKGERPVTLDERFGAFTLYGGDPETLIHVRRRWNCAKSVEKVLTARLGRTPIEAMTASGAHPLEALAGRLLGRTPWTAGWGG
jgi:CTP:molybdopterin cytidylyltransferase MocA